MRCRGVMTDGGPGSVRFAGRNSSSASPRSARAQSRAVPCCPTTPAVGELRPTSLFGSARIRSADASTSRFGRTRSRAPGHACSKHRSIRQPSVEQIVGRNDELGKTTCAGPRIQIQAHSEWKPSSVTSASSNLLRRGGHWSYTTRNWRSKTAGACCVAGCRSRMVSRQRVNFMPIMIMKRVSGEICFAVHVTPDSVCSTMTQVCSGQRQITSNGTGQEWCDE